MDPDIPRVELISSFMDVTGADEIVASLILQQCNFNLQVAINRHLENVTCSFDRNTDVAPSVDSSDGVRAPIPRKADIIIDDDSQDNFRVIRKRDHNGMNYFVPLRDFAAESRQYEDEINAAGPSHRPSGSATIRSKRPRLDDIFQPPRDIMFFGNFQNARDVATEEDRWIIVNLQENTEFSCQILNRDVWSNNKVKAVIKEHYIFWQVTTDNSEGYRFKTFYHVTSFPYVCVIDPRTGENKLHWNQISSENFDTALLKFIHELPKPSFTTTNCSKISIKERVSDDGQSGNLPIVNPATINLSEEEQMELAIKNSLQEICHDLNLSEPESEFSLDSTNLSGSNNSDTWMTYEDYLGSVNDDTTKLSLWLPDDTREIIEWPSSTKLKAIKLYVESKYKATLPTTYKVLSGFPLIDILALDQALTLTEANLHPRAVLRIHFDD